MYLIKIIKWVAAVQLLIFLSSIYHSYKVSEVDKKLQQYLRSNCSSYLYVYCYTQDSVRVLEFGPFKNEEAAEQTKLNFTQYQALHSSWDSIEFQVEAFCNE